MTNLDTTSPFIPSPGVIIVAPYEVTLNSGVMLEDKFKESDQIAKVVAVGGDTVSLFSGKEIKAPCKVGDIIWHATYTAEPYTHYNDGVRYRAIKFEDCRAILK